MTVEGRVVTKLWWMTHKDLIFEWRARQHWLAMTLLGVIVVLLVAVQVNVPPSYKDQLQAGLLWLAVLFAGTIALDRSFAMERDEGCLEALLLYPMPTSLIYLSKLIVNIVVLSGLQLVLIPSIVVLTGTR